MALRLELIEMASKNLYEAPECESPALSHVLIQMVRNLSLKAPCSKFRCSDDIYLNDNPAIASRREYRVKIAWTQSKAIFGDVDFSALAAIDIASNRAGDPQEYFDDVISPIVATSNRQLARKLLIMFAPIILTVVQEARGKLRNKEHPKKYFLSPAFCNQRYNNIIEWLSPCLSMIDSYTRNH